MESTEKNKVIHPLYELYKNSLLKVKKGYVALRKIEEIKKEELDWLYKTTQPYSLLQEVRKKELSKKYEGKLKAINKFIHTHDTNVRNIEISLIKQGLGSLELDWYFEVSKEFKAKQQKG